MTTFVALLRAVNVAGNKVDMAALRSGLTGLGLEGVQTYVQSGNVVFRAGRDDPQAHATTIASLIATQTGLDVTVLHVTFLAAPAAAGAAVFAALKLPAQDGEQAVLHDRVVYLRLPHGYGRSKLSNAYFERVLRAPATTRNWRTVKTLVEMSSARA